MEPNKNRMTGYSPAAGSVRSWLGGWKGLAVCAVAIVGAILVFGGTQDAGKWLPLLFVLPCAFMMYMCMKNMGGNQGGGSNPKSGAPKIGPDVGR